MKKDQSVREFYQENKEKIEEWLDIALYKPVKNYPDKIPKKLDYSANRNFRRYSLLKQQMRLVKLVNLSRSKKVLDIGAGFGDFLIFAQRFNFEQIDATDPGICQYTFLKEKFKYYDNVYNLPLQEIDMSEYDTILMLGLYITDYGDVLTKYIIENKNLKDVVMIVTLLNDDLGFHYTDVGYAVDNCAPWKYDREGEKKLISLKFLNLIFKSKNFKLVNHFSRKNDREREMTSKYFLHYQRN